VIRRSRECGNPEKSRALDSRLRGNDEFFELPLYQKLLGVELPWLDEVIAAKPSKRLPVVLTPTEVRRLLDGTSCTMNLIVSLLYGTGLRLRVKDVATTMIYTHVLNKGGRGVVSPLDF
jgi:integrase